MKDLKIPQVEQKNVRGSEVNPIAKWMTATTHACLACALTVSLFSSALPDEKVEARSVTYQLNIPAENLDAALQALALASHHKLLYRAELVAGKTSRALIGTFTTEEAVRQVLSGTDLGFDITPASVVLIKGKYEGKSGDTAAGVGAQTVPPTISSPPSSDSAPLDSNKNSRDRLRLAQATQGATSSDLPVGNQNSQSGSAALSEIIVTAQKREERIQDVPVPVTVLVGSSLADNNQLRIQDYYSSVPGLNVSPAPSAGDQTILSIRGIASPGGNPTVGITVDDVPYGSSTNLGGGNTIPDIDPSDLARIEVLRGPQGTLYGASSMGGLVKFVTLDPSTDGFTGRVQAGLSTVENGAEAGYNFRGATNIPLSDELAIRISGFTRQDPGYINNPVLNISGVNEAETYGGHLAILWKPLDGFSTKLSALVQDIHGYGSNDVDVPTPGYPQTAALTDLQQIYIKNTGQYDRKVQAYSLTINAKLGALDLTSLSGYNINSSYDVLDYTYFFKSPTPLVTSSKDDKLSQELRFATSFGSYVDWLFGGYYTYESTPTEENYQSLPTLSLTIPYPTTYDEYAGFTNLTFHIGDRLSIQFGGRESEIRQTLLEGAAPKAYSKGNAFTYLLTPQFKISEDAMVYARAASGYRAGGPNLNAGVAGTPSEYSPDKTNNYEVGFKGDFLDHMLTLDTSIYYINWKDIQLLLTNYAASPPLNYYANGGTAKSDGIEVALEVRPVATFYVRSWVALNDAELTQNFPASSTAYGLDGDRLPFSSRFSGHIMLHGDFPITGELRGFAEGALSYVGDRVGGFQSTPERQDLPGYATTDIHLGATYRAWTTNLFVNNIADRRGVIGGGIGAFPPFAFTYIQPRTVGVSASRSF